MTFNVTGNIVDSSCFLHSVHHEYNDVSKPFITLVQIYQEPIMKSLSILPLAISLIAATAYRIGDAVGILLRTSQTSHLEAFRHQMPRFGISTKARFDISSLDEKQADLVDTNDRWNRDAPKNERLRLSISFDEGFHHIPWLDVYDTHRTLDKLVITFVYSGSDGSIHAVQRETKYLNGHSALPKSFVVEYIWIEEADVDMQGGISVLLLCIVGFILIGLVGECSISGSNRRGERGKDSSFLSSSTEGFLKSL